MNVAVNQMNQVTQQNAANSEESASAAEELSSQAQELQAMINTFKLTNANRGTAHNIHKLNFQSSGFQNQRQHQIEKPKNNEKNKKTRNESTKGKVNESPEEVIPLDDDDLKGF